jgi:hypothetical protein
VDGRKGYVRKMSNIEKGMKRIICNLKFNEDDIDSLTNQIEERLATYIDYSSTDEKYITTAIKLGISDYIKERLKMTSKKGM